MYKIFLTVRNRLSITRKTIQALKLHSKHKHQIYIYDNQTDYKLEEHFEFYKQLMLKNRISQLTFNTNDSTFNAFSKAAACNSFGYLHEMDPNKDKIDFLVFLDNDIIVTPGWDDIIKQAWKDVERQKLNNIKIISQRPGGIKHTQRLKDTISGRTAVIGKLGGSALWCVRNNFFTDVGFLNLNQLINLNKKHDQLYWQKLSVASSNQPYIMGLDCKLGIHCGAIAGSVCNALTSGRKNDISFKEADDRIDKMKFEEFYNMVSKDIRLHKDW